MREITRLKHLAVSLRDLMMLPLEALQIEKGHNPRNYDLPENRAHLQNLKENIRIYGVQVPILARFEVETRRGFIVDGECRFRACKELQDEGVEILSVPVIQVQGNDPATRLALTLTANTGKPLSKWEAGSAFQRLVNYGWDLPAIVAKLGFSERYIKEALELTDAPEAVKQLLSERAVTPALALDHIRKSGTGAVLTLRASAEAAKSNANN